MKKGFLFLLLLTAYFCNAQNYQCLQAGTKHYFVNNYGYLRGIRIDSVKSFADSVVYFPFHTPRGSYSKVSTATLDSNGGSWLGKQVTQLSDGTFLFDNYWHDSVTIKTQASFGDAWVFCRDTSSLYYEATVIGMDTMSVAGMIDSVKRILITAQNGSGIVTSDPVDSFQIILSKNNGFVSVFDLYTFPYHKPDSSYVQGLDFYLDISSEYVGNVYLGFASRPSFNSSVFNMVNFINPTQIQLYSYSVGDVYEGEHCFNAAGFGCGLYPLSYTIDSIAAQYFIGTDTVVDSVVEWKSVQYGGPSTYSTTRTNNISILNNQLFIDSFTMPEEVNENNLYYYFPNDSSYCLKSPIYTIVPNGLRGVQTPIYFEPNQVYKTYKMGIGLVDNTFQSTGDPYFMGDEFVGDHKNGVDCGGNVFLNVPAVANEVTVQLFPNPASDELFVATSGKITEITITNLLGQTMYTNNYNSSQVHVDVSSLPPGMYLVRINGSEVRKFVKQ